MHHAEKAIDICRLLSGRSGHVAELLFAVPSVGRIGDFVKHDV